MIFRFGGGAYVEASYTCLHFLISLAYFLSIFAKSYLNLDA